MGPQSHRRRFVNKILTLFKKTHNSENAQYPPELLAKYKISEKTLGVGSFAVVKQCTDINLNEDCAVKIILKKVIAGKRQMLDSEIDILKHVRHAHIVSMRDIYESEDAVYIVTDLCTGGELFQRIVERGTYTESIASDLVRQMLEGLSYLHSQDIVHRDMKPENLLFKTPAENSDLLITDFGLAKLLKDDNQVLTTACGTPGYVAPEVLRGTGHGKPVDLWSVGVIMYTLLSGYTPFYGEDQNQLFDAIIKGDYQFEEEYWSEISVEAKSLIAKFLTLDPKMRITADEALNDPWIKAMDNRGINLAPNVRKGINKHQDLKTLVTAISFVKRLKMVDHLVTDAETDSTHSEVEAEDENEVMFNIDKVKEAATAGSQNEIETQSIIHDDDETKSTTLADSKITVDKAQPNVVNPNITITSNDDLVENSKQNNQNIITEIKDGEINDSNEITPIATPITKTLEEETIPVAQVETSSVVKEEPISVAREETTPVVVHSEAPSPLPKQETIPVTNSDPPSPLPKETATAYNTIDRSEIINTPHAETPVYDGSNNKSIVNSVSESSTLLNSQHQDIEGNNNKAAATAAAATNAVATATIVIPENITTEQNLLKEQHITEDKNIETNLNDTKGNIGNSLENEMQNARISR